MYTSHSHPSSFALKRPSTESTQFPRGQKCHRRHVCISDVQVDTAQFLSRRQQKETSGLGISRWSCLSENFDFCLDRCLYFSPKLVFFLGGQVGAASKHPYKGGIEAFQTTKQHQSTKTNTSIVYSIKLTSGVWRDCCVQEHVCLVFPQSSCLWQWT